MTTLHIFGGYEEQKNKWFKKSAKMLSLATKCNINKSFWRIKNYMGLDQPMINKPKMDSSHLVKIRKIEHLLGKMYKTTIYHAFLKIDKVS